MTPHDEDDEGTYTRKRGGKYFTLSGENVVEQVPEGTEGAIPRTNKKNKEVWEMHYDGYRGTVKSVYIDKSKNPQYPDRICIKFEKATVQIPLGSQHSQSFILKVRNIDLTEKLKIEPYKMERDDKKGKFNIGVTLRQGNEKLANYLDPARGKDLPELVKKRKEGKDVWDSTERDNFLYDHLVAWIEEQDFPDHDSKKHEDEEEEEETQTEGEEEEEDEIPF